MRLKLIHSVAPGEEPQSASEPQNLFRVVVLSALLFALFKLPLCFLDYNPEELRDFDHYLRMAAGLLPYRDFVWFYGPLTPLVYGTFLKILPPVLVSVRLVSFGIWAGGTMILAAMFRRYFQKTATCVLGALFVSGTFGYHSYSHNHILPAVALFAAAYFFLNYWEKGTVGPLYQSFACLLICFFCRPVLTGYGTMAMWWALFLYREKERKIELALSFLGITLLGLLFFRTIYGSQLWSAFLPQPWAIMESKGYPNLRYLIPQLRWQTPDELHLAAMSIRGALETAVFYGYYFIWPTLILTAAYYHRARKDLQAAAITTLLSLAASLDLLHYGFANPLREQAMWVRGQYFFALAAFGLFFYLWPMVKRENTHWFSKITAVGVLAVVGFWSYLPFLVGMGHFGRFPTNEYQMPALRGVLIHPDRRPMLEAISFINSLCAPGEGVVVPQYDPGLARLLKCQELFENDSYAFTRGPAYRLKTGESPYAKADGVTNWDLIEGVLKEHPPRFLIIEGEPPYSRYCNQPGWSSRKFGEGPNSRRLCWKG